VVVIDSGNGAAARLREDYPSVKTWAGLVGMFSEAIRSSWPKN
jgi:hypothetical protein